MSERLLDAAPGGSSGVLLPRATVGLKTGGYRWQMIAGFEAMIGPLMNGIAAESKGTPVKKIERRQIGDRMFYVKRYVHGARLLRPLKYFAKKSRSRIEWRLAERLAHLGVPVVPHLAHGERWSARGLLESVLITEAPRSYVPLGALRDSKSEEVARALGSFMRMLHEAGVFHHDLHASNILVSPPGYSICLVDLDKITVHRRLDLRLRIASLGAVGTFANLTNVFFEAYGCAEAGFIDAVTAQSKVERRARIAEEAARCLPPRHHSNFPTMRFAGLQWVVREDCLSDNLRRLLYDPDGIIASDAHPLKRGGSTVVASTTGLVIKRYEFRGFRRLVRNNSRNSRARRTFRNAYHLELAGIPTARALACADRRRLGVVRRGYVVSQQIADAVPLGESRAAPATLSQRIGEMLGRLHDEGFSHRDLQAANILVDAEARAYLIDMDGLRYLGEVSDSRAVADLARLAHDIRHRKTPLTGLDGARLLRAYCRARGRRDTRWWLERVASASRRP